MKKKTFLDFLLLLAGLGVYLLWFLSFHRGWELSRFQEWLIVLGVCAVHLVSFRRSGMSADRFKRQCVFWGVFFVVFTVLIFLVPWH